MRETSGGPFVLPIEQPEDVEAGDILVLVVTSPGEDSTSPGIDGDQSINWGGLGNGIGAAYVFVRDDLDGWAQQAYIKASDPSTFASFGESMDLRDDGDTFVAAAYGFDGYRGAGFVFHRDELDQWAQTGYLEASNGDQGDRFGTDAGISADGRVIALSAPYESSSAIGIDGDQLDNYASAAGAVYTFSIGEDEVWTQESYVKASTVGPSDYFGWSVELDAEGTVIVVGAPRLYNPQKAGSAYVFVRDEFAQWSEQGILDASNPDPDDYFGTRVAVNAAGDLVFVSAVSERSFAHGLDGDQNDDFPGNAGAVYMFALDGPDSWEQGAYIKASNTGLDHFGTALGLGDNGMTLAVGACTENSAAVGVQGDQYDESISFAGAVYVY